MTAYDYALYLLARTPKTVKTMRTTLLAKHYDFEEVEETIKKLINHDYLNDKAFCQAYIRSEVINKGKSLQLVRKKLFEKGIPADILKEVIETMREEIEETSVRHLAREIRKLSKRNLTIISIYEKLSRKGHSYDDIKEALEYMNEEDQDTLE